MCFFDKNPSNVITDHIAWHGTLNQFMSELFLHAHKPMSYILWQSNQEAHYFFSYVVDTFTISHKLFFKDPVTLLWKYKSEKTTYQNKNFQKILQFIMRKNLQGEWEPIIHASKEPIYLSDIDNNENFSKMFRF